MIPFSKYQHFQAYKKKTILKVCFFCDKKKIPPKSPNINHKTFGNITGFFFFFFSNCVLLFIELIESCI